MSGRGLRAHGCTIAVALVALFAVSPASAQELIDRVFAVVGGRVITRSDVDAALAFGFVEPSESAADPVRETLDELIRRQLVLSEVERYSAPEPDPALLDQRVREVRARFVSEEDFEAALRRTGYSASAVRGFIRDTLRAEQYLRERFSAVVQPTEDEVRRYFDENPAEFEVPFDAARQAIRTALMLRRREEVMTDWLDRLRRRTDINDLYAASAGR